MPACFCLMCLFSRTHVGNWEHGMCHGKCENGPLGVGFGTTGPCQIAELLPGGNNNGFMMSLSHKIA